MTPAGTFLLSLVPILVSYYVREYRVEDQIALTKERDMDKNFDFIVVGAGAAGCIVARRLADAKFKVLLLEAGGDPPPIYEIPIAGPNYVVPIDPVLTYQYRSTKQKFFSKGTNGVDSNVFGKMMGGSSSITGWYYNRGSPLNYDYWAKVTGDDSFSYSKILKYFRKMENYHGNFSDIKNGQHGIGGPITITSRYFPQRDIALRAGMELKFDIVDPNGPERPGFAPNENFIDLKGNGVGGYSAYIKPVEKELEEYLTVRRYSPVNKVMFQGKKAVGVEYTRYGKSYKAHATKEVILSAGAIISPILLIYSGVGPKDELKKVNVKPVQVLPQVGRNLRDHVYLPDISFRITKEKSVIWNFNRNFSFNDLDDALFRGTGPQGKCTDTQALIVSTRGKSMHPGVSDLALRFRHQPITANVICDVIFNRPESVGRLRINASATGIMDNYLPLLNYNYFKVQSDLDVVVEGIEFCFKVYEGTNAFQELGLQYAEAPLEPCSSYPFPSKSYWRCYVEYRAVTAHHPTGTNKMGKKGDMKRSVVDTEFKVQGVKNLRVIDASVFPKHMFANNAGPTFVTAEKAVDGMIQEYLVKTS